MMSVYYTLRRYLGLWLLGREAFVREASRAMVHGLNDDQWAALRSNMGELILDEWLIDIRHMDGPETEMGLVADEVDRLVNVMLACR